MTDADESAVEGATIQRTADTLAVIEDANLAPDDTPTATVVEEEEGMSGKREKKWEMEEETM